MRKILYIVGGLGIGGILLFLLIFDVPMLPSVKSTPDDFHIAKNTEMLDGPVEKDPHSSIFDAGSYQMTEKELKKYEAEEGAVSTKKDPMFYTDKKESSINNSQEGSSGDNDNSVKNEGENEVENNTEAEVESNVSVEEQGPEENTNDVSDSDESKEKKSKKTLKGFNVSKRSFEDVNISKMLKDFKKNGHMPVDSADSTIHDSYGLINNNTAIHSGVDFGDDSSKGKNVYASVPGVILAIEKKGGNKGYGNYVVIGHDGYNTLYAHLDSVEKLKIGDSVDAGEKIGKIGSTGATDETHLHFEIRIGDVAVDPSAFLAKIKKGE